MKCGGCAAWVVALAVATTARAQVRVDIQASAVTPRFVNNVESGVSMPVALPAIPEGQELVSAYLWMNLGTRMLAKADENGVPGCVAAVALSEYGDAIESSRSRDIYVPRDSRTIACLDITNMVRQRAGTAIRMCTVAIEPCENDGETRAVYLIGADAVAGWLEYTLFDHSKRDELLRH